MTKTTVLILGAVLLVAVLGIIVLAALDQNIPDVLPTVAVADLTGLLGLLAPRPGSVDAAARRARRRVQ